MIFSLLGPLLYSFKRPVYFVNRWKDVVVASLAMMAIFVPWDIAFTAKGVWYFNHDYTIGMDVWHLPLEEWMFFLVIPFACVFVYEVMNHMVRINIREAVLPFFYVTYGLITFILSFVFHDQVYTLVACGLAAALSLTAAFLKPSWSGKFLRMYIVIWIPFLIVNGILTGAVTKNPVVGYNAQEIIGLRIHTIPVEDSIYNFSMLFIVVAVYEYLKSRRLKNTL
ncbi:MAG: lycopene cyclase domain-containing protein [Bacteroidia bacterium]|nr:lycopene cyclase domain-containing protein [Bacteroidia bacterium]